MISDTQIKANIDALQQTIPENVTLIAVTKYHTLEETQGVIKAGILDLGENKVQDFLKKYEAIDVPVRWHFIGHLQTNKVKLIIGKVHLIHSVDSLKLLKKINNESIKQAVTTAVLLQFNLALETSKSGFLYEDFAQILTEIAPLTHIQVKGLMCIGPMTKDSDKIRKIFMQLKEMYDKIKLGNHSENIRMDVLSMGMTDDYPIAIEAGSTMVRIGRKIFK